MICPGDETSIKRDHSSSRLEIGRNIQIHLIMCVFVDKYTAIP